MTYNVFSGTLNPTHSPLKPVSKEENPAELFSLCLEALIRQSSVFLSLCSVYRIEDEKNDRTTTVRKIRTSGQSNLT